MPKVQLTEEEKAALKIRTFDKLPLQVRTDVAQARNARARFLQKRAEQINASNEFQGSVRRLKNRWGLNPNQMSILLDISRDRIIDICYPRKKKG